MKTHTHAPRTIAQVRATGSRAKVAVRFDSATIERLDAAATELTRSTGEVYTRSDVVREAVAQLLQRREVRA